MWHNYLFQFVFVFCFFFQQRVCTPVIQAGLCSSGYKAEKCMLGHGSKAFPISQRTEMSKICTWRGTKVVGHWDAASTRGMALSGSVVHGKSGRYFHLLLFRWVVVVTRCHPVHCRSHGTSLVGRWYPGSLQWLVLWALLQWGNWDVELSQYWLPHWM